MVLESYHEAYNWRKKCQSLTITSVQYQAHPPEQAEGEDHMQGKEVKRDSSLRRFNTLDV